ncbi:uncharacterized protein LOC5520052 isoform X2 [Nematostella vectensis]|uniref:uncharacterized protein LOC5520052 isoform X2 n=1 Tax=Nematostella vectensis TaxID=45351 RepID=UPI0020776C08|nr:uncharacterized protein LOC5520052 isoform X2 [Nematostella vectensis]
MSVRFLVYIICLGFLSLSGPVSIVRVEGHKTAAETISTINQQQEWKSDTVRVFDGDILMPRPISSAGSKGLSAASRPQWKLWPGAIIPYKIDPSISKRSRHVRIIKAAMREWERVTCVRFVDKTREPIREYVHIHYGVGCRGSVGRWPNTRSLLTLGKWCDNFKVVLHELGHTIGFWHEQNRPDREKYVKVMLENVIPKHPNFPDDFFFTPSDESSLPNCVALIEPHDPTWATISMCYKEEKRPVNITWSHTGHVTNMTCTHINMPDRNLHAVFWQDNYLCVSRDSVLTFHWSVSRPIARKNCTAIRKNRGSPQFYYLCATRVQERTKNRKQSYFFEWSPWTPCTKDCGGGSQARMRSCKRGQQCVGPTRELRICNMHRCLDWPSWPVGFSWQVGPSTPGQSCVRIYERSQYSDWLNHMMCWGLGRNRLLTMRWSDSGPIMGLRCTQILEPKEGDGGWLDNYFCVENDAPYNFEWSSRGPIAGLGCVQWNAKKGKNGWNDNYLCAQRYPQPSGCPEDWQVHKVTNINHCYKLVETTMSWSDAEEACKRSFNSSLLSLASQSELDYVRNAVQDGNSVWIGFNDKGREGRWEWTDRSPVTFKNWSPNEPNNGGFRENEDCAVMRWDDSRWTDFPCSVPFKFICKKSVVPPSA